jgi:hypothetical protein
MGGYLKRGYQVCNKLHYDTRRLALKEYALSLCIWVLYKHKLLSIIPGLSVQEVRSDEVQAVTGITQDGNEIVLPPEIIRNTEANQGESITLSY